MSAPSSSSTSRSSLESCFRSLSRFLSSLASSRLVISSVTRQKATRLPRQQASKAKAVARCVLPVPGLPSKSTSSRLSRYLQRIRSAISTLLTDGCALKSRFSRVLIVEKRAALMRRSRYSKFRLTKMGGGNFSFSTPPTAPNKLTRRKP